MKSAGVFSTVGSILSGIQSSVAGMSEVSGSYMEDWRESRELTLATKRFERDLEWQKLGQAINSTEFKPELISMAKARYGSSSSNK